MSLISLIELELESRQIINTAAASIFDLNGTEIPLRGRNTQVMIIHASDTERIASRLAAQFSGLVWSGHIGDPHLVQFDDETVRILLKASEKDRLLVLPILSPQFFRIEGSLSDQDKLFPFLYYRRSSSFLTWLIWGIPVERGLKVTLNGLDVGEGRTFHTALVTSGVPRYLNTDVDNRMNEVVGLLLLHLELMAAPYAVEPPTGCFETERVDWALANELAFGPERVWYPLCELSDPGNLKRTAKQFGVSRFVVGDALELAERFKSYGMFVGVASVTEQRQGFPSDVWYMAGVRSKYAELQEKFGYK